MPPDGADPPPAEPASTRHEPEQGLRKRVHVPVTEYEHVAAAELPKPRHAGEPELPEIHWLDVLCVGPIMANNLYALFGRGLLPLLVKSHPYLLLTIRASIPAMVAAGALVHSGGMPLWIALVLPLPYLFFDDPFFYWAGRRYGDRLTGYFINQDPRWKGRIARGERIMEKWGFWAIIACNIPFVPIPISVIYFIAGDSRMPIKWFLLADFIGLEILIGSSVGLGYLLGDTAQTVVDKIAQYGGYISWVTLALVFVYVIFSTRKSIQRIREREAESQSPRGGDH